jgi:hypothetical protein
VLCSIYRTTDPLHVRKRCVDTKRAQERIWLPLSSISRRCCGRGFLVQSFPAPVRRRRSSAWRDLPLIPWPFPFAGTFLTWPSRQFFGLAMCSNYVSQVPPDIYTIHPSKTAEHAIQASKTDPGRVVILARTSLLSVPDLEMSEKKRIIR